jgi:hypothetical protein
MPLIESETVEITAEIVGETDQAYLLFDGTTKAWVPKTLVEYDARTMIATMPEWLATEKKLL